MTLKKAKQKKKQNAPNGMKKNTTQDCVKQNQT